MTETVALYARVSTDDQKQKQTIETQTEYARARAKIEGWTLIEFIDDGVTGTIPLGARPEGRRLLASAARGDFSLVVTYKVDRLGRTTRHILEAIDALKAVHVKYKSLTEPFEGGTLFGDAALGMASVFAQLDHGTVLQRMREGKQHVAPQDNRWIAGVIPFGYVRAEHHKIAVNPAEAEIVRQIFASCIAGRSPREIAAELNRRNVPTHADAPGKRTKLKDKRGRRSKMSEWSRPAVSRILRSELYAGHASFFETSKTTSVVHRNMPPIIDDTTFSNARKAVAMQQQFGGRESERYVYLLRGLVKCGRCKHTITGSSWGPNRIGYYCKYCKAGQKKFISESDILSILWRDVIAFVSDPDQTLRALARIETEAEMTEDRAEQDLLMLARRARELDFQESQLVDMRLARTISPSVYDAKYHALKLERQHLAARQQLVRDERSAAVRETSETDAARQLLATIRERVLDTDDATARATMIRFVTKEVVVNVKADAIHLHAVYVFGRSMPSSIADMKVSNFAPRLHAEYHA